LPHVEKSIEIKAPVEKVWALISNVERIPEWAKGYTEREIITSKQRTGVGLTTHETGVSFGKAYEKDFITTEWVEKEKIGFEKTTGWPWKGAWLMKTSKDGTLFTYTVDFELPFESERLAEIFRRRYEELLEQWVKNIKEIVEKK
jgi:ribosome-associated toxin RatA of RatAB toxin-antitoxin module